VNGLYQAAGEVQDYCRLRHWRICFIGGLVLVRWGEPRQTQDADLTLLTGFGNEESYVRQILATFPPRRDDALEFALQNRVLLVTASNGTPVDISLAALPFEDRADQFS
jgi:hypothetical protein